MALRVKRYVVPWAAAVVIALGFALAGPRVLAAPSHAGHAHGLVHPVGVHANVVQSNNWSGYDEGYLDTHTLFHSISGQWVVPSATQHKAGEAESAANWVGIGGGCVNMTSGCTVTDSTLIQAGTEEDVSSTGQASYSAWWEVLPAPSVTASISVNPGDHVSVSITGPGVWTITLTDLTNGQSFTQTAPYSSSEATAEWIEEAPIVVSSSGSAGEAALPNLSVPDFDLGTVNGANPVLGAVNEMQMVSTTGSVLATPSAPDSDTDGGNVCTYATSCSVPSS